MYFVSNIYTYHPANRKWVEMINYINKYKHTLIKDRSSYLTLKQDINNKIKEFNDIYSKTEALTLSDIGNTVYCYVKDNSDKQCFMMIVNKVESYYDGTLKEQGCGVEPQTE